MIKIIKFTNLFIAALFLLSACNFPSVMPQQVAVGDVLTSAAQTVQAQIVQPALIQPTLTPTFTTVPGPPPTNTPIPPSPIPPPTATSDCNHADFVADITVPDGMVFDHNENFVKTWRLRNIGSCTWTPSYAVVFSSGNSMNGPASQALVGNVNPGQTVDISVNLTAPGSNGEYRGDWKLRDAGGVLFANFYVQIKVQGGGGDGGGGPFAVTGVTYSVHTFDEGSYNNCPSVTAHITTNGAGDVDYHWRRSDNASAPVQTVHFDSAGTKNVNEKWYLGSVWAGGDPEWLGVYIDSPNHQNFGHVNVPACSAP
jgi:hypothetical protein